MTVDKSQFAKKDNLANLKSDVEKLDIDTLKKVWSSLKSLKSKVDKLGIGKLKSTPNNFKKIKWCSW